MSGKIAIKITEFIGSWTSISIWILFVVFWCIFNQYIIGFDKYPYILLNLVFSLMATFQASIVLMSQKSQDIENRKEYEKLLQELREIKDKLT